MANEYAEVAELKSWLGITDTARDALLARALTAASRAIDRKTGRRFWLADDPEPRVYNPYQRVVCDERGALLITDDIGDPAGVVVEVGAEGSWTTVGGYETYPDNAITDGCPVLGLLFGTGVWGTPRTRVRVTARWGWPEIPEDIGQATVMQAARLYRRKDSPEGVAGSAEWGLVRVPRLDPDVAALVEPFERPGFG